MRRTGSREVTNRIWAQQTDCVVVPVCAAACSGAVKRTERPFGLLGDGSSPSLRWVHTQSARSDPLAVGFSFMVVLFVCFSTVKKKKVFVVVLCLRRKLRICLSTCVQLDNCLHILHSFLYILSACR